MPLAPAAWATSIAPAGSLLGDEVAIKVMQATPDAPPELRERFLRESRACAQLRHPNIVGLLDFGFDAANQPYMVMELLSGPSLREEIDLEAPMAPARVAAILGRSPRRCRWRTIAASPIAISSPPTSSRTATSRASASTR